MLSLLYGPSLTSIHDYRKNHSFDYTDLVGKVMSLLFNTLSRFAIVFLPRSKRLLISWLQSPSTVILQPKKIQSGGGNGEPLQYSCIENPMGSLKRQKDQLKIPTLII